MKKYLFFDTETTGFPFKKKPLRDPSQPHIVQLAASLCTDDRRVLGSINFVVRPDGFSIPTKVAEIHGITNDLAKEFGVDIGLVLHNFYILLNKADLVVAHNFAFDELIMNITWAREKSNSSFPKNKFCTMKESINTCKIPGKFGNYKWPKLIEAYQILVDPEGFEGIHDAMIDVKACMDVFFAIKEKKKGTRMEI